MSLDSNLGSQTLDFMPFTTTLYCLSIFIFFI